MITDDASSMPARRRQSASSPVTHPEPRSAASSSARCALQLRAAYGSRDSVDATALASAQLGSGFVTLAGQYARGDGFTPVVEEDRGPADRPAPYEQASLALRSVFDVGGGAELQASLSGFTDRRDRGVDFTRVASDGADDFLPLLVVDGDSDGLGAAGDGLQDEEVADAVGADVEGRQEA